jgi:hypothetical protein
LVNELPTDKEVKALLIEPTKENVMWEKQAQQNVVVEDLVRENAWFCQQKCLTKDRQNKN